MTHVKSPHLALAESFCSRIEIPVVAAAVLKMAHMLVVWSDRANTRRQLQSMNAYRLDDIGLTETQARTEYLKPFWKP
jgi:uncharacterized protein YjiS (DUF1127 family)